MDNNINSPAAPVLPTQSVEPVTPVVPVQQPQVQPSALMPDMGSAPPPPPSSPVSPTVPPLSNQSSQQYSSKKGFNKLFLLLPLILLLGGGIMAAVFLIPRLTGLGGGSGRIVWWGLWEDEATVASLISQYKEQNPNVEIIYEKQSKEDYRERLTNALASGNGPDIFRFHNSWTPMFSNELEPMPSDIYNPAEYQQIFYPSIVSDMTVPKTGKISGIPLGFDTIALFINEDIFESYAKSPPQTWDEFRSLAKELTIKDESGAIKQAGAAMGNATNVDHWQEILALLMIQNRVKMNSLSGPLAEAALDFYTRFSRIDEVWDSTLPTSTIAFSGGKVAMYLGPSWRIHEIKQQNPSLRFKVVKVPQLPKESESDPDIYYATYWAEGVSSQSKAKKQAWDFLKFVSNSDSLQTYYEAAVVGGRLFGEPYPRIDMKGLLTGDPIVGAFVEQGDGAKSWYLASRTFDGANGINSKLSKYFEDAVNSVSTGTSPTNAIKTLSLGVSQVLSQYGLSQAPQTPQ